MVNLMLRIFYHENRKPIPIKQLLPTLLLPQPLATTLPVFRVLFIIVLLPLT